MPWHLRHRFVTRTQKKEQDGGDGHHDAHHLHHGRSSSDDVGQVEPIEHSSEARAMPRSEPKWIRNLTVMPWVRAVVVVV